MVVITTESASILSLPLEIHLEILALLPDPRTLASAALSCRHLYAAFKRSQDDLVRTALIRCIGTETLPEATVVHRCKPPELVRLFRERTYSSSVSKSIDDYALEFVSQLRRPAVASTTWTLGEAIQISDFHCSTIYNLVTRFIHFCSQSPHAQLRDSFAVLPTTQGETGRIIRALYRFELFTKLYGCFHNRPVSLFDCAPGFFLKFAPWEHTQLGCIHDFLGCLLAPIFNTVAKADNTWSCHHNVPRDVNFHDAYVQHLLSMGLGWIDKLTTMRSVDQFSSVLLVDSQPPRWNHFFLEYALRDLLDENYNPDFEQLAAFEDSKPFFDDKDPGSESIWAVSRSESSLAVYSARNWQYRRWGYALWDLERLQLLGTLDWPWRPTSEPEKFPEDITLEDEE